MEESLKDSMYITYVIKRNGKKEEVKFDKIQSRIKNLSKDLDINPTLLTQKVSGRIYNGITTSELDELVSQISTSMSTVNNDYGMLSDRLVISNNQKNTHDSFLKKVEKLSNNKDKNGNICSLVSDKFIDFCNKNKDIILKTINYENDFKIDFFGFKTLEKAYLMKINGKIIERVQDMYMRVAIGIFDNCIDDVVEAYNLLSNKHFIFATPTLFNAGTNNSQLLSCFLLGIHDSISGIYKNIRDCALISKDSGGIGIHIQEIRGNGEYIRGSNGKSNGIIPMCRVYNETAKYVNQGGKRNGSIAVYIELHHPDILEFLDLRKNNGIEDQRCRDLFLALMVSDLFMKKLEYNLKNPDDEILWYLFDPDRCPELNNCHGEEYEKLYDENIKNNKYTKSLPILTLARKICSSQIETGTPYILFKDRINKLSNQKNIGVIRSSNLCAEIVEYSDDKEYACCCLSSISLPSFVYKPKIKEKIKIYTKTKCKYCKMLKKELEHYEEINLDNDDERFKFYTDISKKIGKTISTVPQIFIGDKYIGSYDDFKKYNKNKFSFDLLEKCCKIVVRGLNNVVDKNKYPIIETKISNFRHRPLGIGIQGFADLLFKMKYSFESKNARDLNKEIFEHIQYFCLKYSMEISKFRYNIMKTDEFEEFARKSIDSVDKLQFKYHPNERLPNIFTFYYKNEMFTFVELLKYFELKDRNKKYFGAYSTFEGSPLSKGIFQYELANEESVYVSKDKWDELRKNIIEYGVRNSQLIALMPTASTSQILGNNECFEPITSNIYTRRTLAGDFIKINKYLVDDLSNIGLWNNDLKDEIIANNGSIQKFDFIPNEIKEIYKTSWEIKQKRVIDLAADRTPFICQTQSMNLFFEEPTNSILVSSMLYGWKRGLKTGSYYIRSRPKVKAQQFTIDPTMKKNIKIVKEIKNETCDFCSG